MIKKYEFTKEELIDFFNYVGNTTAITIFDDLHRLTGRVTYEEVYKACEDRRERFQEIYYRLENSMSQEVLETANEIENAAFFCSLDEMFKEQDSK